MFSYPTVHTQQSSVPNGVAEHNVTVARAFTKLMGALVTFWDNDAGSKIHLLANPGQDVAPIGAVRQEDSLLESQMQLGSLQYPHNPMKGASEHFHFLSVLAGTYDDTVRNIDIGRVGLPAPQLHCRLSHRARAQDAAEWCQHSLGRPCPVHLQGPGRHIQLVCQSTFGCLLLKRCLEGRVHDECQFNTCRALVLCFVVAAATAKKSPLGQSPRARKVATAPVALWARRCLGRSTALSASTVRRASHCGCAEDCPS